LKSNREFAVQELTGAEVDQAEDFDVLRSFASTY
jgi:hypothetical protein